MIPEFNENNVFDQALLRMKTLHDKKSADYSSPENRFSNFELSATFSNIPVEQVFEVLLGIKQARLLELLNRNPLEVKNEPLEDTYLDRAVYAVLAYAYYKETHNG